MAGGAAGKGKGAKGKNFKGFGGGKDGEKKEERMPHELAGKTDKDIRDPDSEIQNADWLAWYTDIQIKMQKVVEENKKVEDDILRRQNRYIMREMDYRQDIEELQAKLRITQDNGDSSEEEDQNENEEYKAEKIKQKYKPVVEKLKE